MYLSSSDDVNGVDIDDNLQARQGNTPPVTSAPSQPSSPSCPTLLVIDDNSYSNDSSVNTTDIPTNPTPSTAQSAHIQVTPSSPVTTTDVTDDTPEKQRRRNSSIAKLLGGKPLNKEQYEKINQQILDDQSAQNSNNTTNNNNNINNNNDNETNSEIPRSRSSKTRTLLMNAERNDNTNPSTKTTTRRPSSPDFPKSFEYLIRRELDIEHAPSPRNSSSAPNIFHNMNSARNTPPIKSQSPSPIRAKRKKLSPKDTVPTPPPPPMTTKSSNMPPFAIREPFELDPSSAASLVPRLNPTVNHRTHPHQNDLFHFDPSHRSHHRHPHPQGQFSLPITNSSTNSPSYPSHKLNSTTSPYSQFKIHHDRLTSSSSPFNCYRFPQTANDLALPIPVSSLSAPSIIPSHTMGTSSRKTKSIHMRPDMYEIPSHRPYSTIPNQSNQSTSPSSSGHSAPLKKRLLDAYKNEQRPSSLL